MSVVAPMQAGFLASFCLVEEQGVAEEMPKIAALAAKVAASFKYWEIVYVVGEHARPEVNAAASQIAAIRNLRIVLVNEDISYYRRRVVAASEAIGDVVALSSFEELDAVDLLTLAIRAYETGDVWMGRSPRSSVLPFFHAMLAAVSTYRVNSADLKSIALPRARLEGLLARPTATLDLRFEPKRGGLVYRRQTATAKPDKHRRSAIAERYELAAELVANSAPRFLKGYAALSIVVVLGSIAYAGYAVETIIFVQDVAPGWFSTAIVQAGSVAFVAGGVAIICLGAAEIYERIQGRSRYTVADEISNTSYFDQTKDINVDVEVQDRIA